MTDDYLGTMIREGVAEFKSEGNEVVVNWDDLGLDVDNISKTTTGVLTDKSMGDIAEYASDRVIRDIAEVFDVGTKEQKAAIKEKLGIE